MRDSDCFFDSESPKRHGHNPVAWLTDVLNDGEVELLRAAADAIGAPVPPLTRRAG